MWSSRNYGKRNRKRSDRETRRNDTEDWIGNGCSNQTYLEFLFRKLRKSGIKIDSVNISHSRVEEQTFKRVWNSSTFVMKAIVINASNKSNENQVCQARKRFPSKRIAKNMTRLTESTLLFWKHNRFLGAQSGQSIKRGQVWASLLFLVCSETFKYYRIYLSTTITLLYIND